MAMPFTFYMTSKPRAMRNTNKNTLPTSVALNFYTGLHFHPLILVLGDPGRQEGSGILFVHFTYKETETLTF